MSGRLAGAVTRMVVSGLNQVTAAKGVRSSEAAVLALPESAERVTAHGSVPPSYSKTPTCSWAPMSMLWL